MDKLVELGLGGEVGPAGYCGGEGALPTRVSHTDGGAKGRGGGAGLFTEAPSRAPERARGEQFGTLKGPQEMTCSSSVDAPFSLTGLKKRLISVGDEMALRSVAANGRGLPRGSPSHCQLQESEDQRAS